MALHICASGFGKDWDGTYEQIDFDTYGKLPDQDYWIYHDSWYWFISISQYEWQESRRVAQKAFIHGIVDPTGAYIGVGGNPNGTVSQGDCL